VSAVHTGNGGLVIEVSDIGIGMTESDLRVANRRLQSGGEVDPYTARHMGMFVVGRLASQHGLVVRLRSTIAGEPNSGTTAGVFVPSELLAVAAAPDQFGGPEYTAPADAHAGIHTALALDEDHEDYADYLEEPGHEYTNGHSEVPPIALLPQRNPGASGISDIPASLAYPAADEPQDEWPAEELWPADSMPAQTADHAPWGDPSSPQPDPDRPPVDTSSFFASRAQAASNGTAAPPAADEPQQRTPKWPGSPTPAGQPVADPLSEPEPARHAVHEPSPTAGADDAIYQKMLSEWLVDPTELAKSEDLNWESVWDHGWSAAAAAESAPVVEHTDEGLPMRQPGARLVPGAVDLAGSNDSPRGGYQANGGAHRSDGGDDEVPSAAEFGTGGGPIPSRDPDAVRASISNHFGGVHAGRSHARGTRGIDNE
jgi:hypothetical protein